MTDEMPPEPPDGTQLVVTEPDGGDTYVVYRDDELAAIHQGQRNWYYSDSRAINPRKYPMTWAELCQHAIESDIELHAIGAPFPGKTVEPEDMQDGKRYRVIFEGTYNSAYARFDRGRGGWINDHELTYASRIEEMSTENE